MLPESQENDRPPENSLFKLVPGTHKVFIVDTKEAAKMVTERIPPGWSIETRTIDDIAYVFLTKKDPSQK